MSGKKITSNEAIKLCNNFDAKHTELTKLIKKEDNRSVLFSLEELKNYITFVEEQSDTIDGIRVYLGSNKETQLTTVFLCPTEKGKDNTLIEAYNMGTTGNPPSKKYGK